MAHQARENTPAVDPYEEVPYPGHPFPQTHPDRLFRVGVLHGLDPSPPDRCRVLEIGCGDGLNLVAMAAGLPGLRGLGIDRAALPLERGRRYSSALGIDDRVELRTLDLLDAHEEDLGSFDYVVAHGVYAWVPEIVRDGLLALAARALAPNGIAFVSYNAYPGGHIRRAMRDLLLFHGRTATTAAERVVRAREIAAFTRRWDERTDPYGAALLRELERLDRLSDHSLVHDDLSEVWEPCSLSDFVAHATAHGLRYVGDADREDMRRDRFPAGVEEGIAALAPGDVVAREQYGDLISGRPFRQSLLCRAELAPSQEPVAAGVLRLRASSRHRPDALADGSYASAVDAVCATLAERHPRTATPEELAAATGVALDAVAEALLSGFRRDVVDLHARPPLSHPGPVPERPCTWPLARLMAAEGPSVPTLDHSGYKTQDPFVLRLVTLLDGTRDRAALLQALLDSVGREIIVEVEGEPLRDPEPLRELFAERLDEALQELLELDVILDET